MVSPSSIHPNTTTQFGGAAATILTVIVIGMVVIGISTFFLRSGFSNGADAPTPVSLQERIADEGHTLLVFGATWCGPCQTYKGELERFAQAHPDVPIIEIDVDDHPQLAQTYGVRGIPATVIYRDGEQVDRRSGVIRANDLPGLVGR